MDNRTQNLIDTFTNHPNPRLIIQVDQDAPIVTPVYHTVLGRIADALEELVEQGKPEVDDYEDDRPTSTGKVYWAPLHDPLPVNQWVEIGHTSFDDLIVPGPQGWTCDFKLTDIDPAVLKLFYGPPETVFVESPAEGFDYYDIDWGLYNEIADYRAPLLLPLTAEAVEALGEFAPAPIDLDPEDGVFIHLNDCWEGGVQFGTSMEWVAPIDVDSLSLIGDGSGGQTYGYDGYGTGFYRINNDGLRELGLL